MPPQPQPQPQQPSARERVLTHPDLLVQIVRKAGRVSEELVKLSGVNRLWRDVVLRPDTWEDVMRRLPACDADRRDPFGFAVRLSRACAVPPIVRNDDWMAGLRFYVELDAHQHDPGP